MTWEEKGKLKLQLNFMAEPLRTVLTEKDLTPSPSPSGNSPTTQSEHINGTQEYPFRWYRWRNQGSKEVGTENKSPLLPSSQRNSDF